MFLHDLSGERQPESSPTRFRREEEVEDPRQVFRSDAHARVVDLDHQTFDPLGFGHEATVHRQPPAVGHRVHGVGEQRHENLFHLLRIPPDLW